MIWNESHDLLIVANAVERQEVGCTSVWENGTDDIFRGVGLDGVSKLFRIHCAKESEEICCQANDVWSGHRSSAIDLLYDISSSHI